MQKSKGDLLKSFVIILLTCFLGSGAIVSWLIWQKEKNYQNIQVAIEQGDPLAQYQLGAKYLRGDGVIRDFAEAFKWFQKAADQGLANAQYALGLLYELGEVVRKDKIEARKWYRRAAAQGNPDTQRRLDPL